jgi:hypothetical protein
MWSGGLTGFARRLLGRIAVLSNDVAESEAAPGRAPDQEGRASADRPWEISRDVSDCAYGYGVWKLVEASLCRNLLAPSGFVASLNVDAQ